MTDATGGHVFGRTSVRQNRSRLALIACPAVMIRSAAFLAAAPARYVSATSPVPSPVSLPVVEGRGLPLNAVTAETSLPSSDGWGVVQDETSQDETSAFNGSVTAALEDPDGTLWFGTFIGGLDRYGPRTERFTAFRFGPKNPHSLSGDNVHALYRDLSGTLWVGGWGRGLNRFNRWWATDWFGTAIALFLLLLAVALCRTRVRTIQGRNEELERQVATQTTQLQEASQELEAFSYSVSHDLRAPLRHIEGFVSLLQGESTGLDERSGHYMDVIAESSHKMGILIDELLALSRLGRSELTLQAVDLNTVVDDVIRECGPETDGRRVVWRRHQLPTVEGDPTLLGAVFTNLVMNALKFTRPREEAVIEIASETRPDKAGQHVISVRDNGVGFDMAYADQLFGVFRRLTSDKQFEGTGIGLATVQRIVARHGGQVWAEGSPGVGATFFIALPIHRTGGQTARYAPPSRPGRSQPAPRPLPSTQTHPGRPPSTTHVSPTEP